MADDEAKWYYVKLGESKPIGPASLRDLDVEWRTENLRGDSLIWKDGMQSWKKIYDITELKNYFEGISLIRKCVRNAN